MDTFKLSLQKMMDDLEDCGDSIYQRQLLFEMGDEMINRANEIQELADSCSSDSTAIAAMQAGVSSTYVDQIVDQVQKLLDIGMWFSDACEVVAVLTNFSQKAKNFEDTEAINEFWDYISRCCVAPKDVKPVIDMPMW